MSSAAADLVVSVWTLAGAALFGAIVEYAIHAIRFAHKKDQH